MCIEYFLDPKGEARAYSRWHDKPAQSLLWLWQSEFVFGSADLSCTFFYQGGDLFADFSLFTQL
jgi:hypothetical protein